MARGDAVPRPAATPVRSTFRGNAMFRSGLVATLSALVLTGCVTSYTYRNQAGEGDYYYSEPDIGDSDLYGLPYGGYGYGPGGWYGVYSYYGFPYFFPYDDRYGRRGHHGGGHRPPPPPPPGGGRPPGGGGPQTDHDNDDASNDFWYDPRRGRRRIVTPQVASPMPGMPAQGGMPRVRPAPSPMPAPTPRMTPPPAPPMPARAERPEREFRREPVP